MRPGPAIQRDGSFDKSNVQLWVGSVERQSRGSRSLSLGVVSGQAGKRLRVQSTGRSSGKRGGWTAHAAIADATPKGVPADDPVDRSPHAGLSYLPGSRIRSRNGFLSVQGDSPSFPWFGLRSPRNRSRRRRRRSLRPSPQAPQSRRANPLAIALRFSRPATLVGPEEASDQGRGVGNGYGAAPTIPRA